MFFLVLNEFVNFSEYKLIFLELSYIFENTVPAMIRDHNHETVSSTTRKSLECGMEYCHESISEIRKVPFIFKILKNKFNVKIFLINLYGFLKISDFTQNKKQKKVTRLFNRYLFVNQFVNNFLKLV